MHEKSVQHTLRIFDKLCKNLPPLVPEELKEDLKHAEEQLWHNINLSIDEVELAVVVFGKKLWPYREAFNEFMSVYEGRVGENFLLSHLKFDLRRRYKEFMQYGGTFRSLHSGSGADFFTPSERATLGEALHQVHKEIYRHTVQSVLSVDRRTYEKKIGEFTQILNKVEKEIDHLRRMAESEGEHPELGREIHEQIKSFEFGLSLLGPSVHYDSIFAVRDHIDGRRQEKKLRKTQSAHVAK